MGKETKALTPEQFKELTPEQQLEYIQALQSDAAEKDEQLKKASEDAVEKDKQLKKLKAESKEAAKAKELPSFDVDADPENDVEGGEYKFTCPTFTWDEGIVINVRELMADAESKEANVAEKAAGILAKLVSIKSGIVKRKEA